MKASRTIRNNNTGETLTMLVSEQENGGALQLYQVRLPPRRAGPLSPRIHRDVYRD
jgi:hypothetical protein